MQTNGWNVAVWRGAGLCLLMTICGAGNSVPSGPAITSVTVTPNPATAIIGTQVQFAAQVSGTGSYSSAAAHSGRAGADRGCRPADPSHQSVYLWHERLVPRAHPIH